MGAKRGWRYIGLQGGGTLFQSLIVYSINIAINDHGGGGHPVSQLVETLRHKQRWFDSQCRHWNFSLT